MEFDEYQKKVIEAKDGHYLVLAPPGCGKTELLTHRVIAAHGDGVPYEKMLCLTFTNRAARGMRERIDATAGDSCEGLFVGNIHRFCSRFLYDNHIISRSTGIIDELDQKDIMDSFGFSKYNANVIWRNEQISTSDVSKFATRLYQKEAGHPDDVMTPEPYLPNISARNKAQEIAAGYYAYKKQNALMDFDDILLLTYTTLAADTQHVYPRYSWIQVDEVQDLNSLQMSIISLLESGPDATVLYLGDEQQAIYSFMGAKLTGLERLASRCSENHILRLYTNYRSPKYLLDVLNTYATHQLGIKKEFLPTAKVDTEADRGLLNIFDYQTDGQMQADVAKRVENCLNKFPDERIGVLTRSNAAADAVSLSLKERGVEHFRLSGRDVFKTDEFKTLLSHFSLLVNGNSFLDWARVLWMTGTTPSFKDARDLVVTLRESAISPSDFLFREYGHSYIGDFLEAYTDREIVIFDTESTGLDVFNDDIIQIAAVKVRNGKIIPGSEFNVIIETERPIPATLGAEENPMLKVYHESIRLPAGSALRDFLDYVGGDDILGHNVTFDYQILKHNLHRRLHCDDLNVHIGKVWDSLALIRLLEPRLRVYKLRSLLETFGLEGENSHRADDDILATKSLVDFCAGRANTKIPLQEKVFSNINVRHAAERLKEKYGPIYAASMALYAASSDEAAAIHPDDTGVCFLSELRRVYEAFRGTGVMNEIQGFEYVLEFLRQSVFTDPSETTLRAQLNAHLTDIRTFSQADLCDSGIVREKVYVMTIHKAKGLEFDHVMLYDCRNDVFPFFSSKTEAEQMEDARVFYVGLSRARKRLTLLYPASCRGYSKELTPFIEPIIGSFARYAVNEKKEDGR